MRHTRSPGRRRSRRTTRSGRCARRLRCSRSRRPLDTRRRHELGGHIPALRRTRSGRRSRVPLLRTGHPGGTRRRRRGRSAGLRPTRGRRQLAGGDISDVPGARRGPRSTGSARHTRRPRRPSTTTGRLRIPVGGRTRRRRGRRRDTSPRTTRSSRTRSARPLRIPVRRHTGRRQRTSHARSTSTLRIPVRRHTRRRRRTSHTRSTGTLRITVRGCTRRRRRSRPGTWPTRPTQPLRIPVRGRTRRRNPPRPLLTHPGRRPRAPRNPRSPGVRGLRDLRDLLDVHALRDLHDLRALQGRRSPLLRTATAHRRREHRLRQRHGEVLTPVGVGPGPGPGHGRHPRRGTRISTRVSIRTSTRPRTTRPTVPSPGRNPRAVAADPQLVRRVLQPLRRRQEKRRLVQIDPGRRGHAPRVLDPVLPAVRLLVPANHLAHRQRGPQRGLPAVPGDHQPLRTAVGTRSLRPVLGPHHEPEVELPHPHLTMLIRRHIPVDPLFRALLRLRERHHRSVHSPTEDTGTDRAKPPSTIRFATVSNSGGLPASRDRNTSKSAPQGSNSRCTRSAGGSEGSTSRASS
ncbi:hypothetical protein QFZ22_005956 [Streptomyces canus]|uniref:Uncharacterized protein n=1 Tax=Streptomyces canus TaxID=58343 RepID=A0AAW8FLE8_9ACTN|nr:hypothetical protein [Streptomyces canus]